jgi:DNA-directed RNA polymerase specialized sigma24 family protein
LDDAPSITVDFDAPERESEARVVRDAVARLDRDDRELLWLLFEADLSYSEINARTGRAIGGIGPTRQRALSRLQRDPAVCRLVASQSV